MYSTGEIWTCTSTLQTVSVHSSSNFDHKTKTCQKICTDGSKLMVTMFFSLSSLIISILALLLSVATALPPSSSTKTAMSENGAINEKVRTFTGATDAAMNVGANKNKAAFSRDSKAHLMNALEGLDRYPNYLNRWNNERDLDELELALEEQLAKVRKQRETISKRRTAITELCSEEGEAVSDLLKEPISYDDIKSLLSPALAKAIFKSRQFSRRAGPPSLEQVLSGEVAVELDAHLLEQLMDQEMYDVYSFPVFQESVCDAIRNRMLSLMQRGDASLNMATRPIDLDTIGLDWINDLLLHLVVRPISRHLYRDTECAGGDLDWRQGYVASYEARPEKAGRNRLVAHTDDSEVTLNIGLGQGFEGGMLEFHGLRGEGDQELLGDYEPIKGRAVLHAGRHFHQVTQVTKGHRFALILWARSWNGVRAQTCPCCWMNRRQGTNCVCGPRWN